jgi:putative ABC transport system permease protein
MTNKTKSQNSFSRNLSVGWFLAKRDIKRASFWTTALIVAVMMFTFLNLVVVSGILIGLIEGSEYSAREYGTGDIIISSFLNKSAIEKTPEVIKIVESVPGYDSHTVRYTASARVESDYRSTLKPGEKRDGAGGVFSGIDPELEEKFSGASKFVIRGEFLDSTDFDSVLLGKNLLYEFTPIEAPGFSTLKNIDVGSRVRVTVGNNSKEYVVKGIMGSKVDEFDSTILAIDSEVRKLSGQKDLNADGISLKIKNKEDSMLIKQYLLDNGVGEYARVQTFEEAMPKFLTDIKNTFNILGNAISAIGLVVASITIFIVIFVNAITRRRFIGILKGIGINRKAILYSYMMQAMIYAGIGIIIGIILVFALIKPYFMANPIDFPFSDGILVATVPGTIQRAVVLLIATIVAGYIPARMVVKQNTLSAILGR